MARESIILARGKIGDLVSVLRNGKYYVRSVPAGVKQTEASRRASDYFSKAATIAAAFRKKLLPVLYFPKAKKMQNDFQNAIRKWRKEKISQSNSERTAMRNLITYSFNKSTSVAARWQGSFMFTQPSADEIALHIPSFVPTKSIAAPANTTGIECTFAAACVRVSDGAAVGDAVTSLAIKYDPSIINAESILLPVKTEAGCLVIVAASMMYQLSDGKKDDRAAFLPSSVDRGMVYLLRHKVQGTRHKSVLVLKRPCDRVLRYKIVCVAVSCPLQ